MAHRNGRKYPLASEYHTTAFYIQDGIDDLLHKDASVAAGNRICIDPCYTAHARELFCAAHTASYTSSVQARLLVRGIYLLLDESLYEKNPAAFQKKIGEGLSLTEQLPEIFRHQTIPAGLVKNFEELQRFYFYLYYMATYEKRIRKK